MAANLVVFFFWVFYEYRENHLQRLSVNITLDYLASGKLKQPLLSKLDHNLYL